MTVTPIADIGKLIGSAANAAFTDIAKSFATAATHFIDFLWASLSSATAVTLDGSGFKSILDITFTIALSVCLLLFIVQIATSAIKRTGKGLSRALRGMLVCFLGTFAAIGVVDLLLKLADTLSTGIVRVGMGVTLANAGPKLLSDTVLASLPAGGALLLLMSLGFIVATVIVWFSLVIRKLLIVVTAVFAPLAFAGAVADITVGWTRKWTEMTLALIFSKVLLVIIFVTGYAMLLSTAGKAGTGVTQTVTQTVAGLLILALAGLAPWMALKIVHFTGSHMAEVGAMAAVGGAGGAMIASAPQKLAGHASTASSLAGHASKLGGSSSASGAGGGAAAGAAATGVGIPVAAGMAAASAAQSATRSATEQASSAADQAQGGESGPGSGGQTTPQSGAPSGPASGSAAPESPPPPAPGQPESPPASPGAPPPPPPPAATGAPESPPAPPGAPPPSAPPSAPAPAPAPTGAPESPPAPPGAQPPSPPSPSAPAPAPAPSQQATQPPKQPQGSDPS